MQLNYLKKMGAGNTKNLLFYIFILTYVFFLVFLANKLVLSIDEPFSLKTSSQKIKDVINLAYIWEGQPPAYFILLAFWRKINDGILFARLLSILSILFSGFFIDKTVRLAFAKTNSRWIIILFLLNPFTVWTSLEIRLYAFLILLTSIEIYLFYSIYIFKKNKYQYLFFLTGLFGVYTQYYFAILLIGLASLVFISNGLKSFIKISKLIIFIGILALPNLYFIAQQFKIHDNTLIEYTFVNRVRSVLSSSIHFFVPVGNSERTIFWEWIFRIVFLTLFALSLKIAYKQFKQNENIEFKRILEIILLLSVITLIFFVIYSSTNLIFSARYITVLFPLYCLVYAGFSSFKKQINNIVYASISTYFIYLLLSTYHSPYIKNGDIKALGAYVQEKEKEKETIYFYPNFLALGFEQYYKGTNKLVQLPDSKYDSKYLLVHIKDTIDLKKEIEQNIADKTHFLFITSLNENGFVTKNILSNQKIDLFFKNNYKITVDTIFQGIDRSAIRVRRLFINK